MKNSELNGKTNKSSEQYLQRYQELKEQLLQLQLIDVTIDDSDLLWGLSKCLTYQNPECLPLLKQSLINCGLWIPDNLDLKEHLGLLVAHANIKSYERRENYEQSNL